MGLGHGIAFIVYFQKDFQQYERLVLIGFEDEPTQPYMMLCISVEVTWKLQQVMEHFKEQRFLHIFTLGDFV